MRNYILTVGSRKLSLARDLAISKQKWRKHLVLVAAKNRFLGLVEEIPEDLSKTFRLYEAYEYLSQYQFETSGQPPTPGARQPLRVHSWPRVVVDWEMTGRITIDVRADWVLPVNAQSQEISGYFFDAYQSLVAPSSIAKPESPLIVGPDPRVPPGFNQK